MRLIFPFLCLFIIFSCKDKDNSSPASDTSIQITPAELTVGYESVSEDITITSNAEWGIISSASWCKASQSGGLSGSTTITLTFEKNDADTARHVTLTFKSGTYRKYFTIKQAYLVKEVSFTDDIFKQYCIAHFDTDGDGICSLGEASVVTSMNISGLGISSLAGIESFTSLTSLNCSNNSLTSLNTSNAKSLKTLDCSNNQLTTLDISLNVNLTSFNSTGNSTLTSIYVWTGFTAGSGFSKPSTANYIEPEIPTPLGYQLVWQDEFNDARDANGKAVLPNTSRWYYETGGGGWGNNELETYVAGVTGTDTCASVYDGSLKIVAKKVGSTVYSIRMNTNQNWTYGYFEARLKLPGGKGTWPAFWMMPKNFTAWPDDGEMDIMEEVGYNPNYVSATIHCKAYNHTLGTQKTAATYVSTAESDFHIYALEWTADYIKGYVDGVSYFYFENDHANNYSTWPFYTPFMLKLNLAWGGSWGGAQGVDETKLPATYMVDYVRVFQK